MDLLFFKIQYEKRLTKCVTYDTTVVRLEIIMSTINQRINVTFNSGELDAIKLYAKATDKSLSQAVAGLALRSLEELDDILLGEKAIRRLQKSNPNSWLSIEDFEKAFDELPE